MAAAASEPNTASKTIRTIGRFHCSACGDVVLGGRCGGGAERALADDVELDLAVLDLARLVAVDPDLLTQLLGDVDGTGVVEVQLQRHDVGAVRLRRRLLRVGHHLDAGHLAGKPLQMRDRGVHVGEGRVGPRRRDQGKRRRPLVGELLLELVLDVQRLRTGDLESAPGEVAGLVHGEIHRRHEEKQPDHENRPAESAQATAQAHHELLDGCPAFSPSRYVA